MMVQCKDLKPGQHVQGNNPDHIYKVENVTRTPTGVSVRFSLHGVLTDFVEQSPYDSFPLVTLH